MKYSTLRLISGAFIIVGILLSQSLLLRFCITVFIIILASNSGRKFRLLPNLILLVTISFAHTFSPYGLVIFSIGSYPITLGALSIGANKAFLLISFIYASHYMMSSRPQIPGKLGAIISLQFYYFDRLTTNWHQIEKKRPLIGAIDQLLLGIEKDIDGQPIKPTETRYVVKKDIFIHIFHISIIILLLLIFSDKAKSIFPFIALLP
ncbi:MAG: hypothetical protein JJE21_06495 [Spirochaetaceae bacterium]|nr:hypothetical protein [Spirochaetaceae bacterium]